MKKKVGVLQVEVYERVYSVCKKAQNWGLTMRYMAVKKVEETFWFCRTAVKDSVFKAVE